MNIVDEGEIDLTRAYEEYISCYCQQEGTKMLSFEQWIVTPIFCFKLEGALHPQLIILHLEHIEHHQ